METLKSLLFGNTAEDRVFYNAVVQVKKSRENPAEVRLTKKSSTLSLRYYNYINFLIYIVVLAVKDNRSKWQ